MTVTAPRAGSGTYHGRMLESAGTPHVICPNCNGDGEVHRAYAGVALRRAPGSVLSVGTQQECGACRGRGLVEMPGIPIDEERLPIL